MARTKQKEFTKETKEILANRAGNRCSNPECLALISGAAGKSFLNVGEAAHIYVVSEGGPRFDSTLSEEYGYVKYVMPKLIIKGQMNILQNY